jgi:hypothetical protein
LAKSTTQDLVLTKAVSVPQARLAVLPAAGIQEPLEPAGDGYAGSPYSADDVSVAALTGARNGR